MISGTIRVGVRALELILWEFEATPNTIILEYLPGLQDTIKQNKSTMVLTLLEPEPERCSKTMVLGVLQIPKVSAPVLLRRPESCPK